MRKLYEGDNKYIFISYAHKDNEQVMPILKELFKRGYRFWYDEGIAAGDEWPEVVATHLQESTLFICFVSPNFINSQNCRREVNFAVSLNLDMICIYLDKCDLTPGMKMQLGTVQSIFKYQKETIDDFCSKLFMNSYMVNSELKMTVEEINSYNDSFIRADSLVSELTVVIGICKYNGKVLMVKRANKEGNLLWQFPAAIVKPSEEIKKKILREVFQETGIKTEYVSLLGTRIHPDTKVMSYYIILSYVSGDVLNGDDYENEEVQWVGINKYKNYITSNLFYKVEEYLKEEN